MSLFYTFNKLGLLGLYAIVAATFVTTVPLLDAQQIYWLRVLVAVLLGAHALEVLLFRRQVALYRGPFAVSAGLTLLFGFLHWKPLVDAQRRG